LQSKFRRSGRLFLQQELWEADHRRRHRRRRRRRRRRLRDRLRCPKCKRHEESCVACLTQFPPEEAAIASA